MRAWLQAARPLAQANIATPLLFGEVLAFAISGDWNWWLVALTHLAGVFDHLFIVFANDVADEEGDRENTTFNAFSGGSRVLADGKLTRKSLRAASLVVAALLLLLAGGTALTFDRPLLFPGWVAGVVLLWAYSYRPLALSYRGYGELAQGLGVGVILPALGFYAIAGTLDSLPWLALLPTFVAGAASNILTAIPDEPADKACDKQTWPVRFGGRRARKHCLLLMGLAVALTPWVVPTEDKLVWASIQVVPAVLLLWNARALDKATPENRRACVQFVVLTGGAHTALMLGWIIALGLGLAHFG